MIAFQQVSKTYNNSVKALNDVSFECPTGCITALLGPSGCGKTTSLRLINGLESLSSGQILINQECQSQWNIIKLRRQMGYVIQKGGLFPHMTVEANCCLVERIKNTESGKRKKRFIELMQLVELDPFAFGKRHPHELSGGQVQRVGLVRALMGNPEFLLMDEPFGALDPITRESLQSELKALNTRLKKTIIMVTHDRLEAEKLADHIVLLKSGEVMQEGSWHELIQSPRTPFVADFLKGEAQND